MRCERIRLTGDPGAAARRLRALVPSPSSVQDAVAEIVAQVRGQGDAAIAGYTRRFDTQDAEPAALRVDLEALASAALGLEPDLAAGLKEAIHNVGVVAGAWREENDHVVELGRHRVTLRTAPVARAAVYVPGGRAPYPSTVVMGVVTARAAGVREVVVCAPPGHDGELHPVILGACQLTGAREVYRMGGAQAIAALAYGSESVTPVDVIVGPGNLYVQEAKRQVSAQVGIDAFAGPSDLVVIADDGADPELLRLDLLAQAEHGPGALVIGVSSSTSLLGGIAEQLAAAPETGAVAALVQVGNARQALALAQAFAPEHLELVGPAAEALAPEITAAGCVFVGANAGTAFGDYIAGSNHVLPTNGAARFASALSPRHFRRSFTEVRVDDGSALARAAAPIARAEGFELHARSMEARIRENG
ncbi:MAG: histidinol dehydrogenase [Solirubrobacterales bacterium]|nr:histidinol dehydrogenase [Solirubrobacterales bacterium]MBV9917531.1 histidinol dehydrogenase [Solirubrobacterales bacterium]